MSQPYRSSQLFITIFHHLENNLKNILRQENCFESTSGTTTKYFVINLLELFWGGWVPFTKMILQGFSVFEHIILKHLPPTSTSDSFF